MIKLTSLSRTSSRTFVTAININRVSSRLFSTILTPLSTYHPRTYTLVYSFSYFQVFIRGMKNALETAVKAGAESASHSPKETSHVTPTLMPQLGNQPGLPISEITQASSPSPSINHSSLPSAASAAVPVSTLTHPLQTGHDIDDTHFLWLYLGTSNEIPLSLHINRYVTLYKYRAMDEYCQSKTKDEAALVRFLFKMADQNIRLICSLHLPFKNYDATKRYKTLNELQLAIKAYLNHEL